MRNTWCFVIQGWMINELKLNGNELIAYAIIFASSQDGVSRYCGSLKDLSESMGVAKSTAVKSLNALLDKGLINKDVEEYPMKGLRLCYYSANLNAINFNSL